MMMKHLRYLFFALLMLCGSCSDFFEIDRPPQVPWSTVTEFERAAIGAYAGLFSGNEWNMAWVNERIVKSSMGDDVGFVTNPEWGYDRNTKEYNVYTERNFIQLYRVIATVNDALAFVDKHNGNPFPGASQEDKINNVDRIIGELHFIRGYAYYILITTFGHTYDNSTVDIPMPIKFASSATEARNPPNGTTVDIYELITEDLVFAKTKLPEKFDAALHHPSYQVRATKFAAAALLMRTYLQKGEYDKALTESDFIIEQNNGEFDLSEDPIEAWNKSSLERGKEVIFYAPFFDENLPPPSHISVINNYWNNSLTPWVETYMAFSTVTRFNWMDTPQTDTTINIEAKRDKRFSQLMMLRYPANKHQPDQIFETRGPIAGSATIWCNKYYRGDKINRTNVPLIRLAEIYLTRAFLRFQANNLIGAADDLNTVRERAWDEIAAGASYTPISSGSITEQMINDERLIELFNEGDRIDYLRAIRTDIPNGDRGPGSVSYQSEDFVWAIPQLELNFNDGL